MPVTYRIDGSRFETQRGFWAELGRAVNGPDGYFGRNLDALADCLRGGYGTPDDRPFRFVWAHSAVSRARLGERFDRIVAVFADEGVELELR
ncbi:RNAse (barnase) inhibitor barstar [Friedmanniella endophytica]|uniref:RNAse (Barnase) inhibitor barstar n=1 Tax=Microlunatus kandeliicorticis TaxID=1759536 RepID=A0A7W3IQR3_9ACTN|nr:barstar family protein [Microlunatus kandeliicorticis]MBA8793480.1 RNAse (barnase) inhibitor barstar [Microlunatus kandeliicorticis]